MPDRLTHGNHLDSQISLARVSINIRGWKTTENRQSLLRELGMRKVVFDAQLTVVQRTVFSRELRRRVRDWRGGLVVKSARCYDRGLVFAEPLGVA